MTSPLYIALGRLYRPIATPYSDSLDSGMGLLCPNPRRWRFFPVVRSIARRFSFSALVKTGLFPGLSALGPAQNVPLCGNVLAILLDQRIKYPIALRRANPLAA